MRALVAPDLLVEWERRLDDFEGRGWHNHVEPIGEPSVEYVGLTRTGNAETDRVVVKIDARVKDYVVDRSGRHLKRTGSISEITRIREFWTLQKRSGHWILASIEQGGEGKHALDEEIVATAWGDEKAHARRGTHRGCRGRSGSRGHHAWPRSPTCSTRATPTRRRWT